MNQNSDKNTSNDLNRLEGEWSRSWFLSRWQFEGTKNWEVSSERLGSALDYLLSQLVPGQLWKGDLIEDFAGVTPPDSAQNPVCLTVHGKIKSGESEWDDFSLQLETPFHSFRGSHHIIHSGKEARSKNLPSFLKGERIGRAIPLKIESFEINIYYYESKHTVFLGYNPTPISELTIKALPQKIIAKLLVEQLGDNTKETLNRKIAAQNFMRLDLSHLQS